MSTKSTHGHNPCPKCSAELIATKHKHFQDSGDDPVKDHYYFIECSECFYLFPSDMPLDWVAERNFPLFNAGETERWAYKSDWNKVNGPVSGLSTPYIECKETASKAVANIPFLAEDPEFLIVDLFCGAGGTTTGFSMAERNGKKLAKIIACVNHDSKAIKSHWLNHPEVIHYEEDIRTLDLTDLVLTVQYWQLVYPKAKLILWASLECTNFSKAKGGQSRDADSRTLADHLDRYVKALNPDYVQIENVVEFLTWGPLMGKEIVTDEGYVACPVKFKTVTIKVLDGKIQQTYSVPVMVPDLKHIGVDFKRWCKEIDNLGYRNVWRELNSADFGAYTSRNRLFGCFARIDADKKGLPIIWPKPTHEKVKNKKGKSIMAEKVGLVSSPPGPVLAGRKLAPWKPVRDVLDFVDEGKSIFNRAKPLSPKTLERIYAGLIKYVAGGKEAFMLKYNSTSQDGKHTPPSIDEPCPTVACQNRLGMCFIAKHFSGKPEGKVIPVSGPAGTITTSANQSLVQCFMTKYYSGDPESKVASVADPAPTLRTKDGQSLVQCFMTKYYGATGQHQSIDQPAGTLTTKARFAKIWLDKNYSGLHNHQSVDVPAGAMMTKDKYATVQASWLDRNFSNGGQHSPIDQPAGSLLAVPKMNLVQAEPFIMDTNFNNVGRGVDEPAPTLVASRRHPYIVNPSHGGHSTSIDQPCPVIIARQDKAPLYLVEATEGAVFIPVYDDDPAVMVDIKMFMALYGIADIKMRMLKVPELLKIQGFPDDYKLFGNQSDQKKFIGNSVHPLVPKYWLEAMYDTLMFELEYYEAA